MNSAYSTAKPGNSGAPPASTVQRAVRLLDQLRERIRYLHYSLRTEQAYVHWTRTYIRFHRLRHPRDMGRAEIESFLSMLANERRVSPSTHRQALSALLFLYKEVLAVQLPWLEEIGRPIPSKRIPVVLTLPEAQRLLALMDGECGLIARLLYGTGMRLTEGLRLRVKDMDFERRVIVVREGKGGKDCVVMLPQSLVPALQQQLQRSRALWEADRAAQRPGVYLPHALESKYPRAGQSWPWHWVFPAPALAVDPRSGIERRHHLYEQRPQRALKAALQNAQITMPASVHLAPVLEQLNQQALAPFMAGQLGMEEGWRQGMAPLREFMVRQS